MKKLMAYSALIAFILVFVPTLAQAQDQPPEVVPLATAAENQPNGLSLQTYFLVRDKQTGRPISPNDIESAQVRLAGNNKSVPAILENPTTPIKIALLLDESGSMKPYVAGVRAAAKDAISKAPEQAQFAIFRFSDVSSEGQIEPNLDFTPKSDSAKINTFIDQEYDSRPEAPTCLYNITLQATHYLAAHTAPGERRAIILFTDGTDERKEGGPCSNRSIDDAIREAGPDSDMATPIYTVGLCDTAACSKIDRAVLDRMATQTKAISRVGTPDTLTGLFYDVMDDLRAQRLVRATITPCQESQATLQIKLVNVNDPIEGVILFTNKRCYTPPATVSISEPQANSAQNTYIFPLAINNSSPLDLHTIAVQVIDPNRTTVYTTTLQDAQFQVPAGASQNFSITIPARTMIAPGDYVIRIQALAQDGTPFITATTVEGRADQVLAEAPFRHTLSAEVQIAITSVRPYSVQPYEAAHGITVTVDIANKNVIDPRTLGFLQYQGRIFADNGNEVQSIARTSIDLSDDKSSFVVDIPLADNLRNISVPTPYKIELILLVPPDSRTGDQAQKSYLSNQQPFTLEPVQGPSFAQRLVQIVTHPLVLVSFLIVIVAMLAFYVRSRFRRPTIPRPFNSATMIMPPPVSSTPVSDTPKKAPPASDVQPQAFETPIVPTRLQATAVAPANSTQVVAPEPSAPTVIHTPTPRLRIKVLETPDSTQVREQTVQLPCTIGREHATFTILGDAKISRVHAVIRLEDGNYVIADCKSTNGSFVDGVRLASGQSTVLNDHATLRLGPNTTLEVELRKNE